MGCGGSVHRFVAPPGTRSLSLPDPVHLTRLLDTGYPINKAILPGCDTVLVLAARFHFVDIVEKVLDCHGEIIAQDNLDAALLAALSTLKSPIVISTVVLLLHHGATLCSALRLSRVLRAVGLHDLNEMKDVVLALVMSSKDILVEGVVLNALCNAGIQMRVRLTLDVIAPHQVVEFLKKLLTLGVRPEAFWSNGLQDLCLQGDESRQFKPSAITITFIQACCQNDTLRKILGSSTIFSKPCDNVLEHLRLLGQAGYFSEPGQRLTPQQLRNLITLNPFHANEEGEPEVFAEYLDCVFRQPRTLVNLSVLQIRRNLGDRNVFHGLSQMKKTFTVPRAIGELILLEQSS